MVVVQAPAHAGTQHPGRQLCQAFVAQAKGGGHRRDSHQVDQLAHAAAARGQVQQPLQRRHHRVASVDTLVGNVEGNVPRIAARMLAKHGGNGRRHGLDVGHHDHDVARLQRSAALCRGLCQQVEQLVVQHLQLAHRTVGHMEHQRGILTGALAMPALGQRTQVADVVLQLAQHGCGGVRFFFKQVAARQVEPGSLAGGVVKLVQQAHEIAGLPPPRCQQGVGMSVHVVKPQVGQVGAAARWLAVAAGAQQFPPLDDVGPVKAAWVGHRHEHLAATGQSGQCLQRGQGKLTDAKHHHPARQRGRSGLIAQQARHHPLVQTRPNGGQGLGIEFSQQGAPQPGLPHLVGGRRMRGATRPRQLVTALRPLAQPVGPVHLVLVKQVGQSGTQLKHPQRVALTQKALHGFEPWLNNQLWQQPHEPPRERRFVHGRMWRHLIAPQHLAVGAPQKTGGQFHPHRRTHTTVAGQLHLQPFGHAVALHQHHLFFQWAQGVLGQPVGQGLQQPLGSVAVQGQKAGMQGVGGHGQANAGNATRNPMRNTPLFQNVNSNGPSYAAGANRTNPSWPVVRAFCAPHTRVNTDSRRHFCRCFSYF